MSIRFQNGWWIDLILMCITKNVEGISWLLKTFPNIVVPDNCNAFVNEIHENIGEKTRRIINLNSFELCNANLKTIYTYYFKIFQENFDANLFQKTF